MDTSVFHDGERHVQERLGIADEVAEYSSGFIRSEMPEQHRAFFENGPLVVLGMLDEKGHPWATPVFGADGFIKSSDKTTLSFDANPVLSETVNLTRQGDKIGLVGIELETRRRNRMNGVIAETNSSGFTISVDQSFGNCPQYIQQRTLTWGEQPVNAPKKIIEMSAFSDEARSLIDHADTFFIASRSETLSDDPRSGVDASHRGGRPGFVKVDANNVLSFPDFSGNRFFNTLGNIVSDGRVGLFLPDFKSGDAVFLTGRAEIIWDGADVMHFEGAERIVTVIPERIFYAKAVIPKQVNAADPWPVLEETGVWSEAKINALKIDGYRRFTVTRKIRESATIISFYLEPADGGPIENHEPGQFLPIKLTSNNGESVLRTYTISQATNGNAYRLSVKREPEGKASRILHDAINQGDVIEVGSPAGDFVLEGKDNPVVLISAGVGITPMMAMLDDIVQAVEEGQAPRKVWFIHAAENSDTRAFAEPLRIMAAKYEWLTLHIAYSNPMASDVLGESYDNAERLSVDTLKALLPFDAHDFYLCGPEGFMRSFYNGLRETGIDKARIHYEFFGAGTLEEETEGEDMPSNATVRFAASDKNAGWMPQSGSLLETAEAQGLRPAHNCRSGKCGTCSTRLLAGEVRYSTKPAIKPKDGHALICCAYPAHEDSEVVLDI